MIFKSCPYDHNVHVKNYLKLVSRLIETLDTKNRPVFETICSLFLCTKNLSDKSFNLLGYSAMQLAYCNIGEGSLKLLWPVWDTDSTLHTKTVLHDFQERSLLRLPYLKLPTLFSFPFLSCSLFSTLHCFPTPLPPSPLRSHWTGPDHLCLVTTQAPSLTCFLSLALHYHPFV